MTKPFLITNEIDITRMEVGKSIDGLLALLLGLTPDDPVLDRDAGDPNVSSKVAAVCSMGGPADLRSYIRILKLLDQVADENDRQKRGRLVKNLLQEPPVKSLLEQLDSIGGRWKVPAKVACALLKSGSRLVYKNLRNRVVQKVADDYFCGQSPLAQTELLESIDPVTQARRIPEMPPEQREKVAVFFLAYGKKDTLVSADGGADLGIALDKAGILNEHHELPNAGHDASGLLPAAFRFLMERLGKENP